VLFEISNLYFDRCDSEVAVSALRCLRALQRCTVRSRCSLSVRLSVITHAVNYWCVFAVVALTTESCSRMFAARPSLDSAMYSECTATLTKTLSLVKLSWKHLTFYQLPFEQHPLPSPNPFRRHLRTHLFSVYTVID